MSLGHDDPPEHRARTVAPRPQTRSFFHTLELELAAFAVRLFDKVQLRLRQLLYLYGKGVVFVASFYRNGQGAVFDLVRPLLALLDAVERFVVEKLPVGGELQD